MTIYSFLVKDGVYYQTQSKFLRDVCVKFKGYAYQGSWYTAIGRETLPFKLSKDERDKYKVALRLMR